MDFDLADKAASIALKSIGVGEPLAAAFGRICDIVLPELPEAVAPVAAGLALQEDVEALNEQIRAVLADEPAPAAVNGLWFGIAEMVWGEEGDAKPAPYAPSEFTLYVGGSTAFDPEDVDWPCAPEWWPEARYFVVPSFKVLSDLCATLEPDDAWLVATGLIEPLSILLVGEVCRVIEPATLLGGASWRGIGSGFDGGDLRDIGVVTRDGFASPALLPVKKQAKPRPGKKTSKKASTKKSAAKKPATKRGTKGAKAKGPAKGALKKSAKKAKGKPGARRVGKKKSAARTKSSTRSAKRSTGRRGR